MWQWSFPVCSMFVQCLCKIRSRSAVLACEFRTRVINATCVTLMFGVICVTAISRRGSEQRGKPTKRECDHQQRKFNAPLLATTTLLTNSALTQPCAPRPLSTSMRCTKTSRPRKDGWLGWLVAWKRRFGKVGWTRTERVVRGHDAGHSCNKPKTKNQKDRTCK